MKKRAALAVAAGLVPAFFTPAFAQQAATVFAAPNLGESGVRAMAANCAPCHGTGGRAVPGSRVDALAGRGDIAESMKAFKEGKREATVMHQIAKGYGDAEIAALARYFAEQSR